MHVKNQCLYIIDGCAFIYSVKVAFHISTISHQSPPAGAHKICLTPFTAPPVSAPFALVVSTGDSLTFLQRAQPMASYGNFTVFWGVILFIHLKGVVS